MRPLPSLAILMAAALLMTTLALAACAQRQTEFKPGRFQNFFEVLRQGTIDDWYNRGSSVPLGIEWKWADCTARFLVSKIDPATLQKLDSVARGETTMPADEIKATYQPAADLLRKDPSLSVLEPFCPKDVAGFRPYVDQLL